MASGHSVYQFDSMAFPLIDTTNILKYKLVGFILHQLVGDTTVFGPSLVPPTSPSGDV